MDNWLFMLVINQWARRNVRMPALLLDNQVSKWQEAITQKYGIQII